MALIEFNEQGLLPTYIGSPIDPTRRSPYEYNINTFARDFINGYAGFNTERRSKIVIGLLEYRQLLYKNGIVKGFHWLDGSFVTNKELLLNSAPNDLDVFSIFELPEGDSQESLADKFPYLTDHDQIKQDLSLDTYFYFVDTKNFNYDMTIKNAIYYHSLWTQYKNTSLHKGYIRVDLSPDLDSLLLAELKKQVRS
jgi:hypothetical protein